MKGNLSFILALKQSLQNPDFTNQCANYKKIRYGFIKYNEGSRTRAYLDSAKMVTVGIGFNMDHIGARQEWDNIFKNTVSFTKVYNQQESLSECQIKLLFESSVAKREKELTRIYHLIWNKLQFNERLAIEDAYFNAPVLVKGGNNPSKFWRFMHQYILEMQNKYLKLAIKELLYHSNPSKHLGISQRRYKQVMMLCTIGQELYIDKFAV